MVTKKRQLRLVSLRGVKQVSRSRKPGTPQVSKYIPVKKFEILHHPFDLNFRGRLYRWIDRLKNRKGLEMGSFLSDEDSEAISLYFYPQSRDRWLTQEAVVKRLSTYSKYNIRSRLVQSLLRIWEFDKKLL